MVHALDADHIMAVSGLASSRAGLRASLSFCFRWACGHGISLLAVAVGVYFFGMAIPAELSAMAEGLVGVMLIAIGVLVLRRLRRPDIEFRRHQHRGLPVHTHWSLQRGASSSPKQTSHQHAHTAVLVGLVHGTAGSAPLLTLIPLSRMGSPWISLSYVLLFSSGVVVAMLLYGGFIGNVFRHLSSRSEKAVRLVQCVVATGSIVFGGCLLLL